MVVIRVLIRRKNESLQGVEGFQTASQAIVSYHGLHSQNLSRHRGCQVNELRVQEGIPRINLTAVRPSWCHYDRSSSV